MKKFKKEILDQYDFAWDEDETIFSKKLNYNKWIGEFLISFSNLESSLNLLVTEAINDRSDELGYQVIKSLTYNNKIQLAKDLYIRRIGFIKGDKLKKRTQNEFQTIISKLLELGTFRNKIAHANWVTLDKNKFVRTRIQQDEGGEVVFMKIKISPEGISKYTGQCNVFASQIYVFKNKVSARLNI